MNEWRGTIIQLAGFATLVAIVAFSGRADREVVFAALGIIGPVIGQSIARARVDAALRLPPGSRPPPGSSLPPIIGAALGALVSGAIMLGAAMLFPA